MCTCCVLQSSRFPGDEAPRRTCETWTKMTRCSRRTRRCLCEVRQALSAQTVTDFRRCYAYEKGATPQVKHEPSPHHYFGELSY